jgi:membrane peptidoglycan carboxypeptidase
MNDEPGRYSRLEPSDYEGHYEGEISLERALREILEFDRRAAAAEVGARAVAATAHRLGIDVGTRPCPRWRWARRASRRSN